MKIIVTGGCGFIGSHLVDKLVDEHQVVVIDNLSTGQRKNLNNKAVFYEADIRDKDGLRKIFKSERPEVIFHLAAQINLRDSIKNPVNDAEINIIGSLNLIQLAREFEIKKFLFTSTGGAIYSPEISAPWREIDPVGPLSPYGVAKLSVENYLRASGLNHLSLRLANVYGPRQNFKGEAGVIAIFLDKIFNGEDLIIFGDGEQTRDFIYVEDVVKYMIYSMNNDMKVKRIAWSIKDYYDFIVNIGTAEETSINDITKIILEKTGTSSKIKYGPEISGELRRSSLYPLTLAYKKIWHRGCLTSIKDGIQKTIDSMK